MAVVYGFPLHPFQYGLGLTKYSEPSGSETKQFSTNMPESIFQAHLDRLRRENSHDRNYYDWSAERLSHWSEISLDRCKRIKAGYPPTIKEAEKIVNAVGGYLRKMKLEDVFGQVLGINSAGTPSTTFAGIADDSPASTDQSYPLHSRPSKMMSH